MKSIEHPSTEYIAHDLAHRVKQLILQVTQRCNLRCGYCAYSGLYENRVHANKDMSFETAKRAMDFFLWHSDEQSELFCSFYGGEPLLNFDLIQKCTEYLTAQADGKKVVFNITTNGTLLTDRIVDFLMKYKFNLMISLDGAQEDHDAKRKYANGRGTFQDIMDRLDAAQLRYPGFMEQLLVNAVLTPDDDYEKIRQFFRESRRFNPAYVSIHTMDSVNCRSNKPFHRTFYGVQAYDLFRWYLCLLGRIEKFDTFSSELTDHQGELENLYEALHGTDSGLCEKCHPGGPCLPGQRLFVNVDGSFYPCERVSENAAAMNIGNPDSGFDSGAVNSQLNVGRLTEAECLKCWAFSKCSLCAKYAVRNGAFCPQEKLQYCTDVRETALDKLRGVCLLREYNYSFDRA